MEGLIIFNKPPKLTSNQIVNFFKKKFNVKVGHGGTLDPLANGLLIIGLGRATKDLKFFLVNSKKTYLVTAIIGLKSVTYDIEPVLANETSKFKIDCSSLPSAEKIKEVLKTFHGPILQSPPLFSALKFKGKPLYKLARNSTKNNLSLPQRLVKIYQINFLEYKILKEKDIDKLNLNLKMDNTLGLLKFETIVSSGTYVRSLVNELGEKINCGACLFSLLRKEIEIENKNFYDKYGCSIFNVNQSLSF
ncbi:MAG: hypothetical protein KatS3mg095_0609 [Candidatus Parcubacteria bacterium]|nr:MAG: hypothetical protein KatS3mg095_0609 [Candidatus Parcubacteria bacterium]